MEVELRSWEFYGLLTGIQLAAPTLSTLQSLKLYKQLEASVETHKRAEEIAREEAAALRDFIAQLKAERLEHQNLMQVCIFIVIESTMTLYIPGRGER